MTPRGFSTIPCRKPMTTATRPDSTKRRRAKGALLTRGRHRTENAGSVRAGGRTVPMYAYILIQTSVGRQADVSTEIARLDDVVSADPVTGPYDVIVRAEAGSLDELGRGVLARIEAVEGITRTLTCP